MLNLTLLPTSARKAPDMVRADYQIVVATEYVPKKACWVIRVHAHTFQFAKRGPELSAVFRFHSVDLVFVHMNEILVARVDEKEHLWHL